MEDGQNEINKQVNELNAAANEKVEVNCEKACNAQYNALVDKLLYTEKKWASTEFKKKAGKFMQHPKIFLREYIRRRHK